MSEGIITDIRCCARCGGDHRGMDFRKFRRRAGKYSHWGLCPETGEPILMEVRWVLRKDDWDGIEMRPDVKQKYIDRLKKDLTSEEA